ncbi:hypothetical protein [Winogradskyella sp. PG-2]|uniref:hypothetical protein n=1 Tax=Winogradskyella sp. PG-2 TaxID=754409 RepID=UPI0005EE02AE|nr:hypothetical protein [Winogradskyella sp. PG-2]
MIALILFGFFFIGLITFIIIKLSISCLFWASKNPKDKPYVFKVYFPYYIIILFTLCIAFIIEFDKSLLAIYYFAAVYLVALFIWRSEIKSSRRKMHNNNFAVEPNHPNLP